MDLSTSMPSEKEQGQLTNRDIASFRLWASMKTSNSSRHRKGHATHSQMESSRQIVANEVSPPERALGSLELCLFIEARPPSLFTTSSVCTYSTDRIVLAFAREYVNSGIIAYLHLKLLVLMQEVDLSRKVSPGAMSVEVRLNGFCKACPHFMPRLLSASVSLREVLEISVSR